MTVASAAPSPPQSTVPDTLAEMLERIGNVPLERVRARPAPGTATEEDVLDLHQCERRLAELVDGILVEKTAGYREAFLTAVLLYHIQAFVRPRKLGRVTGPDGMMRLFPGLIRIPDIAFVSWGKFPAGKLQPEAVPPLAPDLAVEVLSESNTGAEMNRKRREYFEAGARLVWLVDLVARQVQAFTSAEESVVINEDQTLNGGDVLPGFEMPLRQFFNELDEDGTA